MKEIDIVEMYKKGRSIDYIINKYYLAKKKENKLINLATRRIILIENTITKKDVRGEVYKIIYANLKK